MGHIKSALELAMEKTSGYSVDKDALKRKEMTTNGRKAAAVFLEEGDGDTFKKNIKSLKRGDKTAFGEGAYETIISRVNLNSISDPLYNESRIREGLEILTGNKRQTAQVMDQFAQLFQQYEENAKQLQEMLAQQYGPQLRQKQEQIHQQTGQTVELRPEDDPEFMKILSEQMKGLNDQFAQILSQGKNQLRELLLQN